MRLVALLAVLGLSAPAYANWMSYGPGGGIRGAASHGGGRGNNSGDTVSMANRSWPNAGRTTQGNAGDGSYRLTGGGAGTRVVGSGGYEGGAWTAGGGAHQSAPGQRKAPAPTAIMTASPDNSKAFLIVHTAEGPVKWHISDGRSYKQLKARLGLQMGVPLTPMDAASFDAIKQVEDRPNF